MSGNIINLQCKKKKNDLNVAIIITKFILLLTKEKNYEKDFNFSSFSSINQSSTC